MPRLSYTFDNRKSAHQFISSLDKKTVKARFSSVADWRPDHLALVSVDSEVVAMADCSMTADGRAANCGIVARPGKGAYALTALSRLKKHVGVSHWFATLREPSTSTLAIARRHVDEVYDQGAWEISNDLAKRYGPQQHLRPLALTTTERFLKLAGLPRLSSLDAVSRQQILKAASPQGGVVLRSPSGLDIGSPMAIGMAFDLLDTPMSDRQHFARMMLLMMAGAHGLNINSKFAGKFADPTAMMRTGKAIDAAGAMPLPAGGVFSLTRLAEGALDNVIRTLGTTGIPPLPAR